MYQQVNEKIKTEAGLWYIFTKHNTLCTMDYTSVTVQVGGHGRHCTSMGGTVIVTGTKYLSLLY
jgi:hypothetical protein